MVLKRKKTVADRLKDIERRLAILERAAKKTTSA